MELIINLLKTDFFLLGILALSLLLLILYIINIIKLNKIKKEYKNFMIKLGQGNNIEEQLKSYMDKVLQVKNENLELKEHCKKLDNEVAGCIQKIGLVRYNAFKDTGSDLSFTLAILNKENTGIILNGIYSRDMSNIYAKPVENGQSKYTLSIEEKEAISKAINIK